MIPKQYDRTGTRAELCGVCPGCVGGIAVSGECPHCSESGERLDPSEIIHLGREMETHNEGDWSLHMAGATA